MDSGTLYNAIAEVCPITATEVGIPTDRSTWHYTATAAATQPQKDAADNVIQTIPVDPITPTIEPGEFINRFTNPEYLLLKQKLQTDLAADDASSSRIWDIVIGVGEIDLNSVNAQTLKADLVADGILTQQRADAIFGQGAVAGARSKRWKTGHGC